MSKAIKSCTTLALVLIAAKSYAVNADYITLSGLIAQETQLEQIANNTANVETPGYQADRYLFSNKVIRGKDGSKTHYVSRDAAYRDTTPGALQTTNRRLDIALAGKNTYFKVLTDAGDRYTLDGNLFVNNAGALVNHQGYPIANQGGQAIALPQPAMQFLVESDGTVSVGGEEIDQIGVFEVAPAQLSKIGGNLYKSAGGDQLAENYSVLQGMLRGSNVNTATEMVSMVQMQRSFEQGTNLLKNVHSMQKTAMERLTRQQ